MDFLKSRRTFIGGSFSGGEIPVLAFFCAVELYAHGNRLCNVFEIRGGFNALFYRLDLAGGEPALPVRFTHLDIPGAFVEKVEVHYDVLVGAVGRRIRPKPKHWLNFAVPRPQHEFRLVAHSAHLRPECAARSLCPEDGHLHKPVDGLAVGKVEVNYPAARERYVPFLSAVAARQIDGDEHGFCVAGNRIFRDGESRQFFRNFFDFAIEFALPRGRFDLHARPV